MKKLLTIILLTAVFFSCQKENDPVFTGNELEYRLYQSSAFNYSGTVHVKELIGGDLEFNISLEGEKGDTDYFFPAHLHLGKYDDPNAPVAYLLNPIGIRSLQSSTRLNQLANGQKLTFEDVKNLDGHIKIHLADSGPEYLVILSAGNIGKNDNSPEFFNKESVAVCSPYH